MLGIRASAIGKISSAGEDPPSDNFSHIQEHSQITHTLSHTMKVNSGESAKYKLCIFIRMICNNLETGATLR